MIKAFSFTCMRDLVEIKRLNKQLTDCGINHTMYVDEVEFNEFSKHLPCKSRGRHPNGSNGFGRDGFNARFECIKDMIINSQIGDTILDCDSDVYFNDTTIINDLICNSMEFKGWCEGCDNPIYKNQFNFNSGAVKSYSYDLGKIITDLPKSEIDRHLNYLISIGQTPSEDPMTFYLLNMYGKRINMYSDYYWNIIQNSEQKILIVNRR